MLLRVDFNSGKPIHLQLATQIKDAAAVGTLRAGESLPPIASLAEELRVSRNTIAKAYSQLEDLGIIETAPDRGYRLKEHHRPLRTGMHRTDPLSAPEHASAKAPRGIPRTLRYTALSGLLAALYFALVGAIAAMLVGAGLIRGEWMAVPATIAVAAVFLPLHNRLQRGLERFLFPKRYAAPRALQSIQAEIWRQPNLDAFIERVVEASRSVVEIRPVWIRDRAEVLALVHSFPSLRSAREPIAAGNDFLMPLFSHDEVLGVLRLTGKPAGQDCDAEDREFLSAVGEQVAIAANHFRVRNERFESEYALEIQRRLLPRDIPQAPGLTIAGAWQPAKIVGGDYYDVFRLGDTRLALIVADVSGKGMPAALLMSNLQATAKAYVTMTPSPRELCDRVNRAMCSSIHTGKFITFFYGVLDTKERRVTYTNAGHNPPLVVSRDGGCRRLEAGGAVLGVFEDGGYEQAEIELVPGDRLVIFTDGIIEAADAGAEEFGEERLIALVTGNRTASARELRDAILEAVTQFCRGDFADDATLLTIAIDPPA